jgi:hypothetical protein
MQVSSKSSFLDPAKLMFLEGINGLSSNNKLTFECNLSTSLKHSNATQNIYFSNYVEWQGAVRERWFYERISPDMLQKEGVFV